MNIQGSIYWSPDKCFDGLEFYDKIIPRPLIWRETSRAETDSGFVVYRYEAEVSEIEWMAVQIACSRILAEQLKAQE